VEEEIKEQAKVEAEDIKNEMLDAYQKDVDAIKSRKPAFNKLIVARTLYNRLKKRETENQFMERNGLDVFSYWLDPTEVDGEERYPNINIV
jgi:hypothetical protein